MAKGATKPTRSDLEKRIKELEKKVRDLENRPIPVYPILPQPQNPVPTYPTPYFPHPGYQPYIYCQHPSSQNY